MKEKKFIKGIIWNTLGSTMYGINSFVMLTLVSRMGTVEEVGCFGIAFTTAQLMYIVGLLGINHYQQTDYQEKYTFSEYSRAKLISCVLMVLACFLVIILLGFSKTKTLYTIFLTVLMMLNSVGEMYQSLFFQKNRLDLSGKTLFNRTLWSLIAFAVIIVFTKNILLGISFQIAINLIVTLYYVLRYAPKLKSLGSNLPVKGTKGLIIECFPLFITVLLMNIILNLSKYGTEIYLDDTAQGYYNMIFIPVQVINLCSQFIFKPLLNQYSEYLQLKKIHLFKKMLQKQILMVSCFTIICCIGGYMWGTVVLGFVYKKDITIYRMPMVCLILGGGLFALCQLFYYILLILRVQKKIMNIYLLGGIVSIVLTMILTNYIGIVGAALSFVFGQCTILLIYILVLKKILKNYS